MLNFLHSSDHPKVTGDIFKKIKWFIIIKVTLKMINISHAYNINRVRPRHGHKFTKYKMCISIVMVICIKQHQNNTCSSINEIVKQHWDWLIRALLIKKRVFNVIKSAHSIFCNFFSPFPQLLDSNAQMKLEWLWRCEIQKLEYLENDKSFLDKIKSIFLNFLRSLLNYVVCVDSWVAWVACIAWVENLHGSCGLRGSIKFWRESKKMAWVVWVHEIVLLKRYY